ncbi:predicted protein [Uncinocarpus reesii 1704]|uniref:Ribosome quality control complex subunit 2 n=1 Tax=Uncinocarpus reesii (strain UAMH 1704) TaxID=336963 RepID=C4JFG1_UNCRE|nr:uncharacterized protein UREG_00975 [Uncinocarpus reesii 1704]EEP76126.1 predicted protein [Uncinocarpus reesii 1704]
MKQRYSSLDVQRIYLFKLQKPDVRKQIVIDSGFRCHLTEYTRATAPAPSHFVSRLRQFLKSRRVTAVSQVGTDRIIHIEFSDGQFHLLLEFFASGNIILTDNEFKIVSLLRIVPEGEEQDEIRIGLIYRLDNKQNYGGVPPLSVDRLRTALERGKERDASQPEATTKRAKKKQDEALRRALSLGFPEYPPLLLEHALHVTGFDSTLRPNQILEASDMIDELMHVLEEAQRVSGELSTAEQTRGYIITRNENKPSEPPTQGTETKPDKSSYIDYHPFEPKQFADNPDTRILPLESFNKAVDEYYSSVEAQKLESRLTDREETMKRKLEATKRDHEKRVGALKEVQQLNVRKAQAIEANLSKVEEAINAANSLIAQGMDWVEIARLIEMEQSRRNPIAKMIKLPLKLYENTITILLPDGMPVDDESESESEDEDEEDESGDEPEKKSREPEVLSIDIDLALTPWANASQYYDQKKTAAMKEDKTIKASKKALKSAEKKVTADLKQGLKQEKPVLRPARTPFWFEKFFFFISSDGYLVLGGQDARQDEILYHRHLQKGDVYVHTDTEGAMPMIIKNKPGAFDDPIPPGTLAQAGTFTVATSRAWDTKALLGAWWVKAEQVSRTTATGEYLPTSVVISGEKNHLAPGQLILGFAVLFQISPESVANHRRHRLEESGSPQIAVESEDGKDPQPPSEREVLEHDEDKGGELEEKGEPSEAASSLHPQNDEHGDLNDSTPLMNEPQGEVDQSSEDEYDSADPAYQQQPEASDTATKDFSHARSPSIREEGESVPSTSQPSRTSTPSIQSSSTPKSQQQVRGKRGKAKKLASKYKDQDEEDRELALRLLGSAPKADAPKKTRESREAELQAQKERRRAQHHKAAQAERQRQENFHRRQQEGLDTGYAGKIVNDLSVLPTLVGAPVVGDEIISAIPVCAPWTAVGQCKYRAKLQPGPTGKGKVVREVLGRWVTGASAAVKAQKPSAGEILKLQEERDPEEAKSSEDAEMSLTMMEVELLKGWRGAEVINTIPTGKIRIVSVAGAGGSVASVDDGKAKGKKAGAGAGKAGKGAAKGGKKR